MNASPRNSPRRPSARRPATRRWRPGMTVIVVLGVISITLALSYAMLRSQVTSIEIQSNLDRRNAARQAAYAGISAALRKMHDQNAWGGVDSVVSQDLSDHQWFEVSFRTGDAELTPSDPDYHEYPYRVTLHSIGYASDPTQPDVRSTYRVEAVVELERKQLCQPPNIWGPLQNFTVFQWSGSTFAIEFPVRIEGLMWVQGGFALSTDYPTDGGNRDQYWRDLKRMKDAGLGDYRPMEGPVFTPHSKHSGWVRDLLQDDAGIYLFDVPRETDQPLSYPSDFAAYRLYPGGKEYQAPVLQATYGNLLTGLTLAPDPESNPLGLFVSNGTLTISHNVSIQGTIITTGTEPDIRITGANVSLEGTILPEMEGVSTRYQLPTAIVKDDFQVFGTARCTIRGVVAAWDEFSFVKGDKGATCDLRGRVIANRMNLLGRTQWDLAALIWTTERTLWVAQAALLNGVKYYPIWLKHSRGMDYQPLLTIKPDNGEYAHHWHRWEEPMFIPADGDNGLRWNLIDWTDNVDAPAAN